MKKFMAILLCALLAMTLFTACGGQGGTESSTPESQGSKESSAVESGETSSAGTEGGRDQLTILTTLLPAIQDLSTNDFTYWIQDQVGVDITWQTIPGRDQGGTEKLALVLAGGEYPDVFMNCPFTSDMVAKYGSSEEILRPLDEYIGKITPNLDKVLEKVKEDGITLDVIRQMDGKVYALPIFDTCQHCEFSAKCWYYEPWLKQLNMEVPTTTEEFYEYLKAIKNTDLNGNGQADEIPFISSDGGGWNQQTELYLMNSFIYYNYNDRGLYVEDGKIKSSIDQEAFREGLRYVHKLYEEGLIYADSLTQDNTTSIAIVESEDPMVGVAVGGFVGMFANLGSERANGFRPMSPLKGPEGIQQAVRFPQVPTGDYAAAYMISTTCENPEVAVRLADFMYTEESTLSVRGGLGLKGVGYDDADEGQVGFDGEPAIWKSLIPWNDSDPQNQSWLALGVWDYTNLRAACAVKEGTDMWTEEGDEWQLYATTEEFYAPYKSKTCDSLPPLNFTVEESDEIATVVTDLFTKSYFDNARYGFISGEMSLDTDWDSYVQYLNDNGYTRMKEIYQTAYDRQYGNS